jgi:hypothetical protein
MLENKKFVKTVIKMSKFKLSRQALESTLKQYEENLCKLKNNNNEIPIYGRCTACEEICKAANKDKLAHEDCEKYCPFHGDTCCNERRSHKALLYFKFREAVGSLPNTRNEAIEHCEKIISAIKRELDKNRGD